MLLILKKAARKSAPKASPEKKPASSCRESASVSTVADSSGFKGSHGISSRAKIPSPGLVCDETIAQTAELRIAVGDRLQDRRIQSRVEILSVDLLYQIALKSDSG